MVSNVYFFLCLCSMILLSLSIFFISKIECQFFFRGGCYIHTYILLIKTTFLYISFILNKFTFCKPSGILCLKFNLFDHFRNTLPHLFVISHVDISLLSLIHFSQWSPVYCHLFIFVYLIDGQILDWRVFEFIMVIPSCILFWEFMSLSVPQILVPSWSYFIGPL